MNYRKSYEQIRSIREIKEHQRRGLLFEQTLREMLPWTFRPPLAVIAKAEQLDAFFEWNSWHFIVEAKAKKKKITRGSHDWEDFELKVRKRKGGCIGLFCSLFNVASGVEEGAMALNREGFCTILIHGPVWDELFNENYPFDYLLRYMVFHAKSKFCAVPPSIKEVRLWSAKRDETAEDLNQICRYKSSTFLRRHAHPRHSDIYVSRNNDSYLLSIADNLRPSILRNLWREDKKVDGSSKHRREIPKQIFVFRDASGSGKTTLAVQLALQQNRFFGISMAARQPEIDDFSAVFEEHNFEIILEKLKQLDRPIFYIIDSLDEAEHLPNKKHEVLALLRLLKSFNNHAKSTGIIAFPMALIFTVREEYWRSWESIFEGRNAKFFINKFSMFSQAEFERALTLYQAVFEYKVVGQPTPEARRVLCVPFNLQIFSEAHQFDGRVSLVDVLEQDVLTLYFNRKSEDVLRRQIPALTPKVFLILCSAIAMECIRLQDNSIGQEKALSIVKKNVPLLAPVADEVVLALISDQILRRDHINPNLLNFKHLRFIEYLVAWFIVRDTDEHRDKSRIEKLTNDVFESNIASMYRVHDLIRNICTKDCPNCLGFITDFYAASHRYMSSTLRSLRSSLAGGSETSEDDLKLIKKSVESSEPDVAWDAFFVIVAKNNKQEKKEILSLFEVAWDSNFGRTDRWKILHKLSSQGLLIEEPAIFRIIGSESAKEWEVFLGLSLETGLGDALNKLFKSGLLEKTYVLSTINDTEWRVVHKLLEVIVEKKVYIPGAFG